MQETEQKFKTIYELEASEFDESPKKGEVSLLVVLLKASGIFVLITFIVFSIANYQFIKSQLVDWKKEEEMEDFDDDKDGDNLPDWWEKKYGLSPGNPFDAFEDTDNDFVNNLAEYQNGIDPLNPDTDKDGYFDGEELQKGYNPNGKGRTDSDEDGIYDFWEISYGLDKNNAQDRDKDYDNDGLINFEEFKYHTNPRKFDTDGDGYSDGEEVIKKYDPVGSGVLSKEKIRKQVSRDEDNDGLDISYEDFFGTDSKSADTDKDGFSDLDELNRGYNPLVSGETMIDASIEIPSLEIIAPLIWSQKIDSESIQKDLSNGVIHYPNTAIPGMRGNSYITGHSSYYSWSKSPYKEVFKDLASLKKGDKIIFHFNFKDDKKVDIVYEFSMAKVVIPTDLMLFRDYEGYELTLVTCWPIGTDWKRYMIKANLVSPEW